MGILCQKGWIIMEWNENEYLICKNIAYIRRARGLNQKEMARILGVSAGTLRKMEHFDPTVRIYGKMIHRVCTAFRISADAGLHVDLSKEECAS